MVPRWFAGVVLAIFAVATAIGTGSRARADVIINCVYGSWGNASEFDSYFACDAQLSGLLVQATLLHNGAVMASAAASCSIVVPPGSCSGANAHKYYAMSGGRSSPRAKPSSCRPR